MAIGIPLGIPIGLALDNIALGPALGVAFGAAIGSGLETKYEKEGKIRPLTKEELATQKKMSKYVIGGAIVLFLIVLALYLIL